MKICILTSSYPINRQDYIQAPFLLDFMKILIERGHRVFIYTQNRKGQKEAVVNGVQVKWFNWKTSTKRISGLIPFNPFDFFKILSLLNNGKRGLPKFIKENKIDVCLALWVIPSGYFAYYAHREIGIPYFVWALGTDINKYGRFPIVKSIMKKIIANAQEMFADGFELSEKIERLFHRKCYFLTSARKLPDVERPVEIDSTEYSFLFVGRLEKVKGIDVLISAMVSLIEENFRAKLYVVGDGPLKDYINKKISKANLHENVILLGSISTEELVSVFKKCNCVVIPSRSETISLVLFEALNFDKNLIVTDVGDMGYLAREYKIAEVVPPQNPTALKEMMKKIVLGEVKIDREKYIDKHVQLKRLFNMETSVDRFLSAVKKNK
jgi:glycosyltransferase involved in cell wall biosynthesis